MPEPNQLDILIAPAGSGKTAAALEQYRQILAAGPLRERRHALWLAPTQAAASAVRDALALASPDALLDPGVRTFAAFAAEVVWDAGLRVQVVSTLQRRRLVRRVIADAATAGKLNYFARVATSAGLVNLVDQAIADLQRHDVSADAYRQQTRTAAPRQRDLAELYGRYEQRLAAANLLDPEGLFRAARDGIQAAPQVGAGLELVVVDGFTDFTTAQLEILDVISQRAQQVLVTLPGDGEQTGSQPQIRRPELFAKTQATSEVLTKLGRSQLRAFSLKPQVSSLPPALAHLERNLFRAHADVESMDPAVRNSLDRVQWIAASGVQAELEEIARRVKGLLLAGTPPGEIVVVFRSMHDIADRIRGVFDDFGIPAYFDAQRRLAAAPLVRSLAALLRLHAEDWPYRRLLQVVGDQSLLALDAAAEIPQWSEDNSSARPMPARTAAEFCVRHAQLPLGRRELLEQLTAWAADDSGLSGVDPTLASHANALLANLAARLDQLPKTAPVEQCIAAVQRLAADLGLLPATADKRRQGAESAAWAALVHGSWATAQIDRATGGEVLELRLADFVELVASVAAELPAPEARDATGRVRVLSAESARFVRPRFLFIGGLSEQAFPIARRLARSSDDESEDTADPRSDEMLLFYQLVTRPTESLTLSYPALDAKAQPMPPSPFVVEVERCFHGELTVHKQPLNYRLHDQPTPLSRSDLRRQAVAQAETRDRNLLAALVRSPRYGGLGQSLLDGIEAVASRGDRQKFGVFEGLFSSDAVQAILERKFGPDFLWSPSYLEKYAACPYRFFGEHVLKLQPMPELALESDMARRGSVLHDVLARLYVQLNAAAEEGGPRPTPEAVAQRFQETLDAIVAARPRRGLDGALREIERRQIAAWARKFAEQHQEYAAAWNHLDAPLVPRYFEARFGPKHRRSESADDASLSTDKPYEVTIGEERVRFTGQIDRIDVGRVGDTLVFNVIDYKTSAQARVKPDQIEAGTQIQLPLYAMAVAELLLADKQAAALSAGYWSIRGKGFGLAARSGGPLAIGEIRDGNVQMAAGWSQLRETLLARIGEIVSGIRRGVFPVYSDDKNCGQFCPFTTCCRIAHIRSLEKTWPPASESLLSSGSLPLAGRAGEGG